MPSSSARLLVFSTVMFAACDDASAVVEERDYAVKSKGGECPPWECSYDSAEVNGRAIRELNLDGEANANGVRIRRFRRAGGAPRRLRADGRGRRAGRARRGEGAARGGADRGDNRGQLARAAVSCRCRSRSRVMPSRRRGRTGRRRCRATRWCIRNVDALLGLRDVCNGELLGPLTSTAVVLGGETYDLGEQDGEPGPGPLADNRVRGLGGGRLRLMNYGPQSDFDGEGHPATPAQRQATLKMLTADYCGDGTSYTANGTPLAWENAEGTVQTSTKPGALKGVWGPAGALCLEATRLATSRWRASCRAARAWAWTRWRRASGSPTCRSEGRDRGLEAALEGAAAEHGGDAAVGADKQQVRVHAHAQVAGEGAAVEGDREA